MVLMTSGMSGKVALNSVGDRTPNYELTGTLDNGSAVVIARVEYQFIGDPIWPSGKVGLDNAPGDRPVCGFSNELCKRDAWNITWVILVAVFSAGVAIAVSAALGTLFYR
ncbi:hypothetical protein NP493_1635g00029 [Ridgeia piscesae]|uniref:Uncharacterized protein n=1 Tax=Ridgeia piscesae TaxID=27915 RepID=A0AAD9JWH5_RIDPI|nr:hypothetical protein NP493_1635g00029 [Ridgeia piscesae]